MSQAAAQPSELEEAIVRDSLRSFDWSILKNHLDELALNEDDAAAIIALIRRSGEVVLKRPDPKRATKRADFVRALEQHLAGTAGQEAAELLTKTMAMIGRIEAGYAEILRTLDATVAAKLLPEIQVSAALRRAAFAFHELQRDIQAEVKRRKNMTLQSFRISRSDGTTHSPDGLLAAINAAAGMTLLLLGHRRKWFDGNKYLVLPALSDASDDEIYKAGLTEVLAVSWRHWERLEQRCRYFEGELGIFSVDDIPRWAPDGAGTAVEYDHICEAELYDYLGNQRLNDRMVQTFQEMHLQTDVAARATGIDGPQALPPAAIISAQEGHAGVSLSEILGYSIVDDKETPGGIRLVEWLRGYAVLQELARHHYEAKGEHGLYHILPQADLVALLDRLGLKNGTAERFIERASFNMSSRDLFDQPLLRMHDGQLMLFGPGILSADPGRVTLSAIGNLGAQLSRKGKSFEFETLQFFRGESLDAKSFKFKHDGEEYEFDVLFEWDGHIFIFECKNRTLSGHNPVAAYYFALEMEAARRQVLRLARGLSSHADIVLGKTGVDIRGKTIVPCILNSLPYAANLDEDGVYMSDASSLKRFFQDRYFHIIRPHRLKKNMTVLHRAAMKSLWSGDEPSVQDFLAYLAEPLPLQIAKAHVEQTRHGFGLGEQTVVAVADLGYREMTDESLSKLCGVDPAAVGRDAKLFARALDDARRRHEAREIAKADRAWRSQQRRAQTKKR